MKNLIPSKTLLLCCCFLVLSALAGCSTPTTTTTNTSERTVTTDSSNSNSNKGADPTAKFAGDFSGAQDLVMQFTQPNADYAALTRQLKPSKEDYKAIFATEEMASKAETTYESVWSSPDAVIKPKPGQTQFNVSSVSTENIKQGVGMGDFPGGYKDAGDLFKPGLTLYKFEFKEPGAENGMAYDALVYVNGHWRFLPKPWRLAKL
ncbi:MAG TPA: hypothetical protein VF528_02290 [Pyrinomonadaceae bacterium]